MNVANKPDHLYASLLQLADLILDTSDVDEHEDIRNFENEVFFMHSYCWCEKIDCLHCTPWLGNETNCSEDESRAYRKKQEAEIAERFGSGSLNNWGRAPNFWHKRTGMKVNWYKHIGRGMEFYNPNNADIIEVFQECISSLSTNGHKE